MGLLKFKLPNSRLCELPKMPSSVECAQLKKQRVREKNPCSSATGNKLDEGDDDIV